MTILQNFYFQITLNPIKKIIHKNYINVRPEDASNHIIMDYSIHDAIEAGFNHVVFII